MLDMIQCTSGGAYYARGEWIPADENAGQVLASKGFDAAAAAQAKKGTMAYGILSAHNHSGDDDALQLKFDAMASHDITFVGIIQTARASGLERFPIPYVLTNCHNSLCAVGGTINEDDHRFGLSAAQKYGGIFVPPHLAVIHQYMREMIVKSGDMSIVSDSHTRYGTQGSLSIGEGGPELAKAMLGKYYEIDYPEVIAVFLTVIAVGTNAGIHPVICAVIGALLGFLCFNTHPAKVFMGDTGSLALGGFVAGTAYMLQMPLFLLIVGLIYVVEVLSVMIQVTYFKATHGKRFFKMAPIHHHFELCGWSETRVVAVFSIITAILCLIALMGV